VKKAEGVDTSVTVPSVVPAPAIANAGPVDKDAIYALAARNMIALQADLTSWVQDAVLEFFGSLEGVLVTHILDLVKRCTPPAQIELDLTAVFGAPGAEATVKKLCLHIIHLTQSPPPPPPPPT
jgi:hypothetical protein